MKRSHWCHNLTLSSLLLATCVLSVAVPAQQQIPDAAVAKADASVRAGNYQQALAEALTAIQAHPADFQPYYYAAYALYKQDQLDEAQKYAAKSFARAPAENKQDVQKLLDAIASHRSVQQSVATAQEDENNGLYAKAAQEYAAAWRASPDTAQDMGLKAAHIFASRISQPLQAAPILNYIVAHPQTPDYLQEANILLNTIQAQLNGTYQQNMDKASSQIAAQQPAQALDFLTAASQAKPTQLEPHYEMARAYMLLNRPDDVIKQMMLIAKLGGTVQQLENTDAWRKSLYAVALDPNYSGQMKDIFGDDVITSANARTQAIAANKALTATLQWIQQKINATGNISYIESSNNNVTNSHGGPWDHSQETSVLGLDASGTLSMHWVHSWPRDGYKDIYTFPLNFRDVASVELIKQKDFMNRQNVQDGEPDNVMDYDRELYELVIHMAPGKLLYVHFKSLKGDNTKPDTDPTSNVIDFVIGDYDTADSLAKAMRRAIELSK